MKMWILTSTLSEDIRGLPDIVDIYLSNGTLPEGVRVSKMNVDSRIFEAIFETSGHWGVDAFDVNRETFGYDGKTGVHQ